MRPPFMTTTRSATSRASSWSCVTKTLVTWNLVVQPAQPAAQLLADLRVQGAERLIEQQHFRLDRQGPGHATRCRCPPESWDG